MIVLHLTLTPYLALLLTYTLWIQHERGGRWRYLQAIAIVGAPLDIALNYTSVSLLLWERPQRGEYTISNRLKRLIHDTGWRGRISRPVAWTLDFIAPSGKHI